MFYTNMKWGYSLKQYNQGQKSKLNILFCYLIMVKWNKNLIIRNQNKKNKKILLKPYTYNVQ